MITTVLNGGLGNQMFQIAVAYALAMENNDECAFDLNNKVVHQGNSAITYKWNFFYHLKQLSDSWKPAKVYKQTGFNYKPIPYHKNMQLEGYFQSEKFFSKYKSNIIELFMNKNTENGIRWLLKDKYSVELRNSIGVHIRRGDYLKFPDHHPFSGHGYYYAAIDYISSCARVDCILVFSDDIEWCRKEFQGNIVRYVNGLNDAESMCLMSLCNHNVLANSSFSWWGSYFNSNEGKITCAPKKWFGAKAESNWDDIYREEMVVL